MFDGKWKMEKREYMRGFIKLERCKECKFRIRGKKHEDGDHHKNTVPKLKEKR